MIDNESTLKIGVEVEAKTADDATASISRLTQVAEQAKTQVAALRKEMEGLARAQSSASAMGTGAVPAGAGKAPGTSLSPNTGRLREETAAQKELTAAVQDRWMVEEQGFNKAIPNHSLLNQQLKEQEGVQKNLASTRYALYDTASLYRQMGIAATGAAVGVMAVGASFESAFVNVERTADLSLDKLAVLRRDMVDLSTEIPVAFTEISRIGTLGGQMDIAGDKLEGFAENVAMFAATTDVSVEQTAMSFGRIAQLSQVGHDHFENIAAAVYEVGIHTVATEGQILTMTQQIVAAGNMAGFATDEIVGLAGALASLGVQPERARGSIERSFNEIHKAVDSGGESLQYFAQVSGMSAEQFAEAWKTAPKEAFLALLTGMNEVSEAGGNFQNMLSNMGINAVRDLDTYRRLAANVDLVGYAMDTAAGAWDEGTAHAEAFGLVADTVEAKAKKLGGSVLAILDSLNSSTGLKSFLDTLWQLTEAMRWFLELPVINEIASMSVVFVGLAGVFALVKASMITLQAGMYAVRYAQESMSAAGLKAAGTSRTLLSTLKMLIPSLTTVQSKLTSVTSSIRGMSVESSKLAIQNVGLGRSFDSVSIAASGASSKVMSTLAGFAKSGVGVGLGVTAAIWAVQQLVQSFSDAEKYTRVPEDFAISWSNMSEAIKADTKVFHETGEAVETMTRTLSGNIIATSDWMGQTANTIALLQEYEGNMDLVTAAIDRSTVAIGEQTLAQAVQDMLGNEDIRAVMQDIEPLLDRLGVSAGEFALALATGGEDATRVFEALKAQILENEEAWARELEAMSEVSNTYDGLNDNVEKFSEEHERLSTIMETLAAAQDDYNKQIADGTWMADAYAGALDAAGISGEDLTDVLDEASHSADYFGEVLFGNLPAVGDFEQAMYDLGYSLAVNGETLDVTSQQGRANMDAMSKAMSMAAAASGDDLNAFVNFINQLIASVPWAQGTLVAGASAYIKSMAATPAAATSAINRLGASVKNVSFEYGRAEGAAKRMGNAGRGAGRQAARGARQAAKEIRTLSDYVSDLSGVMKNAFQFRWGLDQAKDSTADQFYKMAEALEAAKQKVKDTKQELRDLQSQLNTMKASQATLEYQLTVAQDYGDSLREQEILAELGKLKEDVSKNNQDQAATSKELAAAEREVARNLSGTTAESREQRAAVLDLVQSYQDQIVALADTGMSQRQLQVEVEKLRQRFISQMLQMGYSRSEALRYAASFGDLKQAIDKIPRNITISTNLSPAQRAIAEFAAKAKRDATSVGNTMGNNLANGIRNTAGRNLRNWSPPTVPVRFKMPSYAQLMAMQAEIRRITGDNTFRIAMRGGQGGQVFWKGGYTGAGNKYAPAGVVHRGEYVFPKNKVDQSTGLPYLSALAEMMVGHKSAKSGSSSAPAQPTAMMVELSPTDRQLLSQGGQVVVTLDGRVVAQAVNKSNKNSSFRGA